MKRSVFLFFAAILIISAVPLMAGGGRDSAGASGRMVLDVMHHNTYETVDLEIVPRAFHHMKERFIRDNPNVTINETIFQQADNHIRMMAMSAAGNLPDVFMLKGSWVQNFYNNNQVADLRPFIDQSIYRPGLTDPMIRDGKLLSVPIQLALTSLVYWNESMWRSIGFTEFPRTWEELVRADALFKERGIITIAHGNAHRWMIGSCILSTLGDRFTGTAWTNSIIANDGRARWTDPEFVNALRHVQQMGGMFNRDFNAITNDQCYAYYYEGRAATLITGSWAISTILVNGDQDVIRNTRFAILPSVPGMRGDPNSSSGGSWGMAANSQLTGDRLSSAARFLDYVSGREYSQFMMDSDGSLGPVAVPVTNRNAIPPLSLNFIDFIATVNMVPVYDLTIDGAVIDLKNSLLQDLLEGHMTPEAVAAGIQAEQARIMR